MKTGKIYKLKIGTNIRMWRLFRGMKQKELASKINCSEAALSNLENDLTVPTLRHIEDLSTALDIEHTNLLIDFKEAVKKVDF